MKGEQVVVRAYEGQPLLRRIWDVADRLIYICSDRQFELLTRGKDAPPPIGFPRSDVFQYDPSAEPLIKSGAVDWRRLKPY